MSGSVKTQGVIYNILMYSNDKLHAAF